MKAKQLYYLTMNALKKAIVLTTAVLLFGVLVSTVSQTTADARTYTTKLASGQTMQRGDVLESNNGACRLVFQADQNLVIYQGTTALWQTRTVNSGADRVVMQGDGNLVLYDGSYPEWNSRTAGQHGAHLAMQDDCNLVIYQGAFPVWASKTVRPILFANQAPTQTNGFPSEMTHRGSWRDCPTRSLPGCGTQGWLASGTDVKMHCWVDASQAGSGARRSNRWFYVTSETGIRGYVFSSNVGNQSAVRHCDEHVGIRASTFAAEHVGQYSQPNGNRWSGWCQIFARETHAAVGNGTIGSTGSAKGAAAVFQQRGLLNTNMDPAKISIGSIIYWDFGGFGHAAVYAGNGYVISTQGGEGDNLPIERLPIGHWDRSGHPVGWVHSYHVDGRR